jgi:hypothetical protein
MLDSFAERRAEMLRKACLYFYLSYLFMPDNTTQKPASGQLKIDFEVQMTGLGLTFPSQALVIKSAGWCNEKAMLMSNGSKCDMVEWIKNKHWSHRKKPFQTRPSFQAKPG